MRSHRGIHEHAQAMREGTLAAYVHRRSRNLSASPPRYLPSNRVRSQYTSMSRLTYITPLPTKITSRYYPRWSKQLEVRLKARSLHILFPASRLTFSGTLVKCDASIKAMLVDIDSKNNNEYIIEELDEEHILVKETKVNELKSRLNQVSITNSWPGSTLTWYR